MNAFQLSTRRANEAARASSPAATALPTVQRDWLRVAVRGTVPPALDGQPLRRSIADLPPVTRAALRLIARLPLEGLTYRTADGGDPRGAGVLVWERSERTWYSLRVGSALEAIHWNEYGSMPRNRRVVREAYRLLIAGAARHHISRNEWLAGAIDGQDVLHLVTEVAAGVHANLRARAKGVSDGAE
jgi:hypothetical protein